jgi:tRNA-modifying protein YgfZ
VSASPFWVATSRDVVRISGPDTRSYLQSQLSQDLSAATVGTSTWSFLLQPTGKVAALVRVTFVGEDDVVLDVDGGSGPDVVARLERFRIRVKAAIETLDWRAVAVRGDAPDPPPAAGVVVTPAWWGREWGYDLLGTDPAPPVGVPEADAARLETARVEAGWPSMGAEITEQTIPGELGAFVVVAVSFTKGCYPGQELVERMDSRGATAPRQLRRLASADGSSLASGAVVTVDGRDVGRVTSAAGALALGLIGRAVEPGAPVTVDGVTATVLDLR